MVVLLIWKVGWYDQFVKELIWILGFGPKFDAIDELNCFEQETGYILKLGAQSISLQWDYLLEILDTNH